MCGREGGVLFELERKISSFDGKTLKIEKIDKVLKIS